jgi:hypothetical protein
VEFLTKPDEVCCLIPIAVTEDVLKKAMASNLTPTQAVYILVAFKYDSFAGQCSRCGYCPPS